MIFISHTTKDKPIVEPIAIKLASIFGRDRVFYDSWSIQPGDGIIDKMDSGLLECKFFFFFVSKNSLLSKMVSLEWQNAILKATKGEAKVIPVKIDDCLMPAILLQSLYIDIYGKGIEVGIRQMVDMISGKNVFKPQYQTYENIRGHIEYLSNSKCKIEIKAEYYLEPISRYCILVDNELQNVQIECLSDSMRSTGQQEGVKWNNGQTYNALFESVERGTTPGFPYILELKTENGEDLKVTGILRAVNAERYIQVPYQVTENYMNGKM